MDQRLVKEPSTGRFIALADNVSIFGPPWVGKTHLVTEGGPSATLNVFMLTEGTTVRYGTLRGYGARLATK